MKAKKRLLEHDAVIAYARFSSDRQNPKSADDQISELREWAKREVGEHVPFFPYKDEATPGALASREGLEGAIGCTQQYERPVLVVESMSRFARSISVTFRILDPFLDAGGRFVSIRDGVDTTLPMWDAMATTMAICSKTENDARSAMVRRGSRAAFARGDSVHRPGYHYRAVRRNPDDPNEKKIVVKREEFQDEIEEYFERIASGQSVAEANRWANSLPGRIGRAEKWESDDGYRMVRNPRYMGLVPYGRTKAVRQRSTGRVTTQPNDDEDDIMWREDPNQRFVSPDLWRRANEALESAKRRPKPRNHYPRNKQDRRSGIWPSGALYCGWCKEKLHRNAHNSYSCSSSRGPDAHCRNSLRVKTEIMQQDVPRAILECLLETDGIFETLCKEIHRQAREASAKRPGASTSRDRKQLAASKKGLDRLLDLSGLT